MPSMATTSKPWKRYSLIVKTRSSSDDIAIIQSTADRIALAAENARLLEDAHRRATKESMISEISTKIVEATEYEKIMAATVRELQKILGASEVSFLLSDVEEQL